jgi:hypothetical protein
MVGYPTKRVVTAIGALLLTVKARDEVSVATERRGGVVINRIPCSLELVLRQKPRTGAWEAFGTVRRTDKTFPDSATHAAHAKAYEIALAAWQEWLAAEPAVLEEGHRGSLRGEVMLLTYEAIQVQDEIARQQTALRAIQGRLAEAQRRVKVADPVRAKGAWDCRDCQGTGVLYRRGEETWLEPQECPCVPRQRETKYYGG